MRDRPHRAVAYYPAGPRRIIVARTAACTAAGLTRFIAEHEAEPGRRVDTWELQTLPGVDEVAQAASPPPSGLRSPS